jgi:hypothetical protein
LRTQLTPPSIIAGSEFLGREDLLFGDHGSDHADRTTHYHPNNVLSR